MAERKQAQDLFLRTYKLSSFKAFNPKFKEECLSGAEMMLFLEIVRERLIYIRIDEKAWNGNTIKIDKEYREKVLENLGVGQEWLEKNQNKYPVRNSPTRGYNGDVLYNTWGVLVPVKVLIEEVEAELIDSRLKYKDYEAAYLKEQNAKKNKK